MPTGGFGGGPRGGGGGGPKTVPKGPKVLAKEVACSKNQEKSKGGKDCFKKAQQDIVNCSRAGIGIDADKCMSHYLRCMDDNRLGCCIDTDERRPDGTRKRKCEPAGVVPP